MESEYNVYAYEKNQVTLYAVQGESESRTEIFNIIEKSGVVISTSNANVTNKMLDLTGYTADLFAVYNQEMIASCQGDITNATKGQVKFTLTADFMSVSGKLTCVIMLKKGSTNLRIVGITLDVQPVMIDPTKENTIKIYKNTAYSTGVQIYDNGEVYILGNTESLIFTLKNGDTDILQKTLTSCDYDEDTNAYILSLTSSETNISVGTYYYNIKLRRADSELEPVIPKSEFIITEG